MSDMIKGVLKGLRNEILHLTEAALKSGATNISHHLANATRGENQTGDLKLGTITKALKSGVTTTGQDLMSVGLERVRALSPEDKTSQASEDTAKKKRSEGKK